MIVSGAERAKVGLEKHQLVIEKHEHLAALAAAKVTRAQLRRALPRDRKSRHPGALRKGVKMQALTPTLYRVKPGGPLAHLVLGDTKEHEIPPAKGRAIVIDGHPYARALHPAHTGDRAIIARVRAESRPLAIAAAREAMSHA